MDKHKFHEPVLKEEVIEALKLDAHLKNQAQEKQNEKLFVDATLGNAGHSIEIVKRGFSLLGIEIDQNMLKIAEKRLKKVLRQSSELTACPAPMSHRGNFKLVQGNFKDIDSIAKNSEFEKVDGILFDLGTTSLQLMSQTRGMSFGNESAPLDMRMSKSTQNVTASDLLHTLNKSQLISLFIVVMPKAKSEKIAEKVVQARKSRKFKKVGDFLGIIPKKGSKKKLHEATLPFLALRIAVNSELENLKEALPKSFELLKGNGRLAVISFHSGEDRIVKQFFRKFESERNAKIINKNPIEVKKEEIEKNPKARSAKLRIIEKLK